MAVSEQEFFQRLAVLFEAAVKVPPGPQREAFLDSQCGAHSDLRDRVVRLLASDAAVQQRASSAPVRLPRFGIYQARALLGAGGMGAVYLATREDGEVRQQVAIKAISSAFHSPLLEERLRRERQILAGLHHPNIAAFLGGGITEDGFSYLAMEYVEGVRIDSWCDSGRMSVEARLRLFLKVCAAVSFAHQHLIIHRDLKPANVLVTGPAGAHSGEPKLLDFGIARTLAADADTAQTNSSQFFTPLYASPEVLQNQPATVAADVYSLGVVLYELLNGRCPFRGSNPSEVMQAATSSYTPALSAGITAEAAAARGQTVHGLARLLRGDLDAVACKALSPSPASRYPSVEQFADDIVRHLNGHPVQAGTPSRGYRARKFLARHKSAVATVSLVTLSLIAGLLATLWEARVAARRFAVAHELAHYLEFDLQKAVARLPGSTPVAADMARHTRDYLDRLSADKINDPALRTEVGEGYAQLGAVLGSPFQPNLGETAKGRESFRKAIAILEPVVAKDHENRRARLSLASSKLELGRSIGFAGSASEGLQLVQEAARESGELAARWPSDFEVRRQAAGAFQNLSTALSANNGYVNAQNLDRSKDAISKAVANADAAVQLRPGDTDALNALAMNYKRLGDITELGGRAAATTFFRQALDTVNRVPEKDRQTPSSRSARASALLGLGWNLGNLGDFTPAMATLEEARQIRDRISQEDPQNVQALYFRTIPYRNLGIISGYAGHQDDKLRYFLADIEIGERLVAGNPSNETYRFSLAEMQADTANLSAAAGHAGESMRLARAGLATLQDLASKPQASPTELAVASRAFVESKVGANAKLGLELAQRAVALDPNDSEVQQIFAEALWMNRDRNGAVAAMSKALELIGPSPAKERLELEKTLAEYKTAPLK